MVSCLGSEKEKQKQKSYSPSVYKHRNAESPSGEMPLVIKDVKTDLVNYISVRGTEAHK